MTDKTQRSSGIDYSFSVETDVIFTIWKFTRVKVPKASCTEQRYCRDLTIFSAVPKNMKYISSDFFWSSAVECWLIQRCSALFQRKSTQFSCDLALPQRFYCNEQRWSRTKSFLNQSWSALNVSETSTRVAFQQWIAEYHWCSAVLSFSKQRNGCPEKHIVWQSATIRMQNPKAKFNCLISKDSA